MNQQFLVFLKALLGSCKDLLPIILVIAFFQFAVLQQPMPNIGDILVGLALVVLGLTFFIYGLEMGLFPIGESMAQAFAKKGSISWLLTFAFCLGYRLRRTVLAQPLLYISRVENTLVRMVPFRKTNLYSSRNPKHPP